MYIVKIQISHKAGKDGKSRGKNPPPKREMIAWMDGVIKTPHYDIHPVYKSEKNEKEKTP